MASKNKRWAFTLIEVTVALTIGAFVLMLAERLFATKAIDSAQVADYTGAMLVGTYEGDNIPANKRSITLRLEYRSDERTLRDDEVEERHRRVIDLLLKEFHAELH